MTTTPPGLYERVLAGLGPGVELPRARIRASASVVPWRRRGAGVEVFWVRRSPELAFMGGWHAFPGGARSRQDAAVPVTGEPMGVADGPEDAGMPLAVLDGIELEPRLAGGLVATAARELFEEVGILPAGDGSLEPDRSLEARRRLESGEVLFSDLLTDTGLTLDARRLVYAGRWLTPPLGPVRFDNRFFLLEWPADHPTQPLVVPGELAEGEWIDPAVAIGRWERGEVITAPPILHILQVLAEDGLPRGRGRLLDPHEANLGPFRRIEFRPGVLLFPLPTATLPPAAFTNAYVVGRREAVLVDPGSPDPAIVSGLVEAVRALEAEGRRVVEIWLTHHHPDHVGGVEAVRRELGVPVRAHRATVERLAAGGLRLDGELADGERLALGAGSTDSLRAIHTPGHARGHMVFLEESSGSLIAGDLVAGFGTIVIDPPEGDMNQYLESLERAAGLGATTLFPAHGPTLWDAGAQLARTSRHRRWREDRIQEAWTDGLRDTEALLDRVYDDIQPIARPLAARQLEAHLDRLRGLSRVS